MNLLIIKQIKKELDIECEKVLLSVGRKPYTEGLNLTKIGIQERQSKGRIEVNEKASNIHRIIFMLLET